MGGRIKITPAELVSQAKTYGTSAEEIRAILSNLDSMQNSIRELWEGQAFQAYDAQYEQLKPKVQEFATLLDEINTQLEQTAQAMDESDQSLSKNFGLQ